MSNDRISDTAVQAAAEWLATDTANRINNPIVPKLKERFGLSAKDAVEAIRRAQSLRWGRAT